MKNCLKLLAICLILTAIGCAPAVIGGGVIGTYKVATDERTVGTMVDDTNVSASIKAALIDDPLVKARHIDVDTVDGNVILTGVVESGLQAKRAVEVAQSIEGVRSVKNNLQIGSKTIGQSFDDTIIGSKIKAKLVKEENVPSMNIDVDVNKGVVTLTGTVQNVATKTKVIDIAKKTAGTIDVVDNITVTEPTQ